MIEGMHNSPVTVDAARTWSIAELAAEYDVTLRTIRFYEDRGLITPERRGTARIYHPRDRVRLGLILRGKRLGFSLDEIRRSSTCTTRSPARRVSSCTCWSRSRAAATSSNSAAVTSTRH